MVILQLAILAVMFVFSACVVAKERFCLNCQYDVVRLLFHASFGTYAMARIYCLLKYNPEVMWWLIRIEIVLVIVICLRFLRNLKISESKSLSN
ncbi:hypothetical protein [Vitreoscilla stercoraria]|uniref:Uncharacterized protein n=1 Tax=Vitreoscilla stercoraria TaxID=61 RepID=A0ABY4ECF3_VITST|nr:hypothetical protein [Vitreoscilla stercoraria]UOO93429.1 hypothetical protein LVJ81_05205 [Vitreoscilla stercoraria]